MDLFNRPFADELGKREPIALGEKLANVRLVGFHLRIADPYVDLLNDLPGFRTLSLEQLMQRLPRKYHKFVPPVGENLGIREAAYEREVRQARACIIGMLAQPEEIERHKPQMFLDRL